MNELMETCMLKSLMLTHVRQKTENQIKFHSLTSWGQENEKFMLVSPWTSVVFYLAICQK